MRIVPLQMIYYYFTSKQVHRSVPYGRKVSSCRHTAGHGEAADPAQRCRWQGHTPSLSTASVTQTPAILLPACCQQPRQRLDMYIPKSVSQGDALPTVIFVTGGAWTIGYKAWGALLGRRLCDAGIITMCLDYRNFPQVCRVKGHKHQQ